MKCLEAVWGWIKQRRQAREQKALAGLKARYHAFRIFLENNGKALELIAHLDGQLHRAEPADIRATVDDLLGVSSELVDGLNLLADGRHENLYVLHGRLGEQIRAELRNLGQAALARRACVGLDELEATALLQAGAKAINLARLRQMHLPVPDGFVCTVRACKNVLRGGRLGGHIRFLLRDVEIGRLHSLAAAAKIRGLILETPLPSEMAVALTAAYQELEAREEAAGRGTAAGGFGPQQRCQRGRNRAFLCRPVHLAAQHPGRRGPARCLPPGDCQWLRRPGHRLPAQCRPAAL